MISTKKLISPEFPLQRVILCCGLFVFFFSLPVLAQNQSTFNPKQADYLWPTSASHALSSTFGETRAGHFHAALDIKTWGRRGYPVYATRSGMVHRLAIGPTGYGKVIYLKHKDGSYSVYAHLLRFNKRLQHWADSVRFRDYTSSIDMTVDSLNFRVEQGEKIGISGASGIGPPHLHFELRTPGNEPFNPLRTNLSVKDTRAPTFTGLAVEPLSVHSKIEGQNRIFTKGVRNRRRQARFGRVDISGPVGLAVNLFDRADGVHNPYAVYKLQLILDGQQVFESKMDQFSYRRTHQMDLDRIYPLLQSTGQGYQRLYKADGNTLPFYQTAGNRGRLNLKPGRHNILIKGSDYFGNSRTAMLGLNVHKSSPEVFNSENITPQTSSVNLRSWQWFNDWVNIPVDQFRRLTLSPLPGPIFSPGYFKNDGSVSVSLKQTDQFFFRWGIHHHFIIRRVEPRTQAYLTTTDHQAYASFPAGCFYDTSSVALTYQRFKPDSLRAHIFPANQPIARSFKLSFKMDSLQQKDTTLSIYQSDASGRRWLSKLPTQRHGDYLTAHPTYLGTFWVLSDTTRPSLGQPRAVQRPDGQWLVYIPARDNRSGIAYQKTRIYLNGVRGITEYEPEDNQLVYYHPDFKPSSSDTVRIIAFDKMGNRTIQTRVAQR